jgi:hypothetical protein
MESQVAFFIAFHGNSTEISNEPAIQAKSLAKRPLDKGGIARYHEDMKPVSSRVRQTSDTSPSDAAHRL